MYFRKNNGIGKEYDLNGKLIFEGEYLNGKKNGIGKEYGLNGKLIFEGEYLNGKKNGNGKEYNDEGKILSEGNYLNGKKNGYFIVYIKDIAIFRDLYENGIQKSSERKCIIF